jgi:DNA-binding winged helix-turn-helix (wHTH) protein
LRELLEILPVESNSDSPWVNDFNATRLRAETLFQLARCGQMPQEAQEIRSLYQSAAQIFESQGHRYSAQVAQLNLCWLELSCQNWAQLNAACATLERMLQSNPQPYLEAGLNVVRSQKCRLHLQFSEALMHADRAQRLLPARAPIHTRLDVAVEKIRAYFFLGNRELAKSELQRIGVDIQEASPSQRVQKQLESLRTELASLEADPTPGQLIVKSADTLYPLQLLVNAQARLEVPIELELSPLGELTALQVRLINTSSVQDREYLLDRLGAVVENSLDPLLEKIAFVLLKAQTNQDVSERHRQLDRALELLKRSPADESAKAPLEHWHRSIERHEPLLVSGKLRRLPAIDRIRWGHWWRWARESSEAMPQQDLQLEIVESSGQIYDASLNDESQLMHFAAGLSISDVTGDVLMKGACISELKRRHNLRRVLICLLEMGQTVFDKSEFTKKVWGENYNPFVHDARIYTSIVRLRQMLPESVIETYGRGYRINPRVSWRLVRLASPGDQPRRGGLEHEILKAFESLEGSGRKWVGRSDIETLVNVSSAQLKRELKKLTESSLLERRGLGKQTLYSRLRQGALDRAQLQL